MEDTILIQNILKGDKKSEQELFNKYKNILTSYLKSKYPQNNECEDDVSEILIKIFTSLSKFNPQKSKFKTWVFTIAKNYMIDKSRCNYVLKNSHNNTFNISINDTTYNNSSLTATSSHINYNEHHQSMTINDNNFNIVDNQTSINYVSNQLETCDFTFLNMHYGYGYSYCEIGNEFNVSSDTVSNRVNYVKDKLRKNNCNEVII
jgi:RNA polymerase sigma factor (sigma-70 family)